MKTNFQIMSKTELKNYLLEHREDQEAFYAYMDKLADGPVLAVHSLSDSESLAEVIAKVNKEND